MGVDGAVGVTTGAGVCVGAGGLAVGLGVRVDTGAVAVGEGGGLVAPSRATSETQAVMVRIRIAIPGTKSAGIGFTCSSPDQHQIFGSKSLIDANAATITDVLLKGRLLGAGLIWRL